MMRDPMLQHVRTSKALLHPFLRSIKNATGILSADTEYTQFHKQGTSVPVIGSQSLLLILLLDLGKSARCLKAEKAAEAAQEDDE